MDEEPMWPDEDDFTVGERMLLDELRWCAGRLHQIRNEDDAAAMHDEVQLLLNTWTARPDIYSDGLPVALSTPEEHHLYAPPHRRGTNRPEGDTDGID